MISRRYVGALMAVLVLALGATLRGSYFPPTGDWAPLTAQQLPADVAGVRGVEKVRTGGWIAETYGAQSWAERTYAVGGDEVGVFVVRSFDMKKLYHHPELGVLRGNTFQPGHALTLGDASQTVHVLQNTTSGASAVYALVHDGAWIGNPYRLQVSSALTSLWTGRRPLTLVFVYGPVLADGVPTPFAADLLRAAVRGVNGAAGPS